MPNPNDKSLGFQDEKSRHLIPQGNNYLLVIGIDQYSNGIRPLNNAVRDAQVFRDILWESYQFEQPFTTELYNEQASRSTIISIFNKLLEQLGPEDNLVFYFSGHGEVHPKTDRGFWIPADGVDGDFSTYLSNMDVIDVLRTLNARHVFGIVDSCFSAALFAQRGLEEVTQRQYSIPSRWLLTSGRLERVSDGRPGQHSPFAESLQQQLRHQEEPALWGSELCRAVLQGISYNTNKQTPRGEPLQDIGHQGGEFVFFRKEENVADYLSAQKEKQRSETSGPEAERYIQQGVVSSMVELPRNKLAELEQKGKLKLAELLIDKINYLKERLIIEPDASVRYKLEHEIRQLEAQLKEQISG